MIVVFQVLLGASIALSLLFILLLGPPYRRADRAMSWFLAATGWSAIAVDGVLFVATLGTRVPAWVVAVALVLQDVAFGWRVWLIARERIQYRRLVRQLEERNRS